MSGSYRPEGSYQLKCTECICGIENGRGIWCARLKRIPTPGEVKRCRNFCPREILDEVGKSPGDEEVLYERDY